MRQWLVAALCALALSACASAMPQGSDGGVKIGAPIGDGKYTLLPKLSSPAPHGGPHWAFGYTPSAPEWENTWETKPDFSGHPANTLLGNNTGSTGGLFDIPVPDVIQMLSNFIGDTGSGGTKGLVPAPAAGDAAAGKVLGAGGGWVVPAGGGTVTTTGSPATGNLAKFSGGTSVTNGDLTGDVTTSGGLATTLATVNSTVGTYGDATHCASVTVNAKGLVTSASQSTSCPGGGGAGVSSITSGTPALTFSSSTGAVTANLTVVNNTQAIASYTIAASDNTKVVNRTYSAGAMTDTLPNVSTTGFGAGFGTTLAVNSSQPDTLTVTAPSTINGVSSITIPAHAIVNIADPDGLNYIAERIQEPSNVAITGGSVDGTAIGITTPAAAKVTNLTVTGTCTGCTGTGAVNSVSNSDGTLTISPTTGAVVASLPAGSIVAQKRSLIYNLACTTYAKSAVVTGTTSETVVASCDIPANLLGANGGLVFETIAGRNSGGTSSLTVKYYFNSSAAAGGMQIGSTQTLSTANLSIYNHYEFGNRGATNSQAALAGAIVANNTTAPVNTGAIDTTAASDIVITCIPGNTGDSCWTEMMSVKFVPAGGN